MAPLVYALPVVPLKIAATTRIKLGSNGVYGGGTLAGSLSSPDASRKLQKVYDTRVAATGTVSFPYLLWGAHSETPDAEATTVFHQPGVSTTLTGHIYSDRAGSTDEADELLDRLTRLFHRQAISLAGFGPYYVGLTVVDVIDDPVGHHGIFNLKLLTRVSQ